MEIKESKDYSKFKTILGNRNINKQKVINISNDVVEYYLPSSVMGDTMPIAEEHLGYSADILQGNNLASLSSQLKKSTVWCFWWD